MRTRTQYAVYILALLVSLSLWFLAVRAPLWLDETLSYSQICAGFSQIMPRQGGLSAPGYPYILWLATKMIGTSEIALRIPSILAMLGAAYLLYLAARELFDRDVAIIAAVVFCLHPIVIFAAIDVRPYAFAALALNTAIFLLVHFRHRDSNWLAALFGLSVATIVYFHLLFGVAFPALAIGYFAVKTGERKALWRQFGIALAVFALVFMPVVRGLQFLSHTSGTHVFDAGPKLSELLWTLAPGWLAYIFLGAVFIAAATRRIDLKGFLGGRRILLCASLGLIPILLLYGISQETSIHIFVDRYRLVAIPGIALCWALLVSLINSRAIRLLFCVILVAITTYHTFNSPWAGYHGYTWKYALEFAEKDASVDGAPVLICSDFPEADHMPMPVGAAVKDSEAFAPLSYYKLSGPVVGLPRTLNEEAIQVGSRFLQDAAQRQQRFLALGFAPSYDILRWLSERASGTYYVRTLGESNGITILEFTPRGSAGNLR